MTGRFVFGPTVTSLAFLLLVQVKRFWAVANKTHLSVIGGASVVFRVAVTKVCARTLIGCAFGGHAHQEGRPADKSQSFRVKVKALTLRLRA